jgi:hypothetical protein
MNPDFTIWLDKVWEALAEEDLTERERMLRDAHSVLERLRPQEPAPEHPSGRAGCGIAAFFSSLSLAFSPAKGPSHRFHHAVIKA